MRHQNIIAAVALLLFIVVSGSVRAEGALAVGMTFQLTDDGIAVGAVVNSSDREKAEQVALEQCRGFKGAPKAVPNCVVIANFRRACYAVAFDPSTKEPGYGYAIAPTKALAEARAIALCKMRSREERKSACALDLTNCDERE
jgi:hypothetical protein